MFLRWSLWRHRKHNHEDVADEAVQLAMLYHAVHYTPFNFAAAIHYTHISMIQHISVSRQNSSENKTGSKDDYHKS